MEYSLATTVFNDEKEIVALLDNICSQSVKPSEIVIADGGSKDNTVDVIKKYSKCSEVPITVLTGKRLNIAQGFNEAIEATKSNFVAIGATGNKYPNNFFESMLKCFEENPEADAICSNLIGIETTPFSIEYCSRTLPGEYSGNHGIMFRKSVFDEVGYFYEKFIYAGEDEEFLQRIIRSKKNVFLIENLFVEWEVPHNYKEYKKQMSAYLLALLQIYENKVVFQIHKLQIFYTGLILMAIVLSVIPYLNILGLMLFLMIATVNIKVVVKKGFNSAKFRNFQYVGTVLSLLKHAKYFKSENKIEKEYRLASRVSLRSIYKKVKMDLEK